MIKIERPGAGDDTRKWGPPFVRDADGRDTRESAYYLGCNRNKRSLTVDIAQPEGAALVRRLLAHCDVLVHNFKVGGLDNYGLAYPQLSGDFPALVYCSITGFGQTGPYARRPGYDYLAQAMGGIMSITGAPDGQPMKVGVAVADIMCGMYASVAILAALRDRDRTGQGQHIDLGLLDTQVAWLANEASNYLVSGRVPHRRGNAHPNIVPYQVFETADGNFVLAVGNESQFRRFCEFAGHPEWADDERFANNAARLHNRDLLCSLIEAVTRTEPSRHWLEGLEKRGVPASPVNDIAQVFEDPQIRHRGLRVTLPHPSAAGGTVDMVANPIRLSRTPVTYRRPPPMLGQHSDEVLDEILRIGAAERAVLREKGVV